MGTFNEPNCELPWDVYLDWLADQGFDDLREVPLASLLSQTTLYVTYHFSGIGEGSGGFHNFDYFGNGENPIRMTEDKPYLYGAGDVCCFYASMGFVHIGDGLLYGMSRGNGS